MRRKAIKIQIKNTNMKKNNNKIMYDEMDDYDDDESMHGSKTKNTENQIN